MMDSRDDKIIIKDLLDQLTNQIEQSEDQKQKALSIKNATKISEPPPKSQDEQLNPSPVDPKVTTDVMSAILIDPNQSATTIQNQLIQQRRLLQQQQVLAKSTGDANIAMYKAFAIKLKKELVKTKDELQNLTASNEKIFSEYRSKIESLEEADRLNMTKMASADIKLRSLRQQLDDSESDLKNLQIEFDIYKQNASQLIQEKNPSLYSDSSHNKAFELEKYNQLKGMYEDQKKHIIRLQNEIAKLMSLNEKEQHNLNEYVLMVETKETKIRQLEDKIAQLEMDNDNSKKTLAQDPQLQNLIEGSSPASSGPQSQKKSRSLKGDELNMDGNMKLVKPNKQHLSTIPKVQSDMGLSTRVMSCEHFDQSARNTSCCDINNDRDEPTTININIQQQQQQQTASNFEQPPSAQASSGSSENECNSSESGGFVHIKPNTFEIVSRSTVLEDAQNQVDELTKAYLDSESTNALLSDQIRALKDEIRRMQRRAERIELAENLEYLKNVMFKFLSLDANQLEQRQRLIPVLSTILKLSPDETNKLASITIPDKKQSIASSFFKL